jgi:hypothetical protein
MKPHSLIADITGMIYPWKLVLTDSVTFPIVQVTSIATFAKMFLFPMISCQHNQSLHPLSTAKIYIKMLHFHNEKYMIPP